MVVLLDSLISDDGLFGTILCNLKSRRGTLVSNVLRQPKICIKKCRLGEGYWQNTCCIAWNIMKMASKRYHPMRLMCMIIFLAFEVSISLNYLTNLLSIPLIPKDFAIEWSSIHLFIEHQESNKHVQEQFPITWLLLNAQLY